MSVGQLDWRAPTNPVRRAPAQLWGTATAGAAPLVGILLLLLVGFIVGVALPGHVKYVVVAAAAALAGAVALRRIELMWGLLFAAGLLPGRVSDSAWTYLAALVVAVVFVRECSARRRLTFPAVLAIYCGWFLVTALHTSFSSAERHALINYLVPPLLAVATAAVARDATIRRRIVVMLIAFAVLEAGVVWLQAGAINHFHLTGTNQDSVRGTLGAYAANLVAYVLVFPATVCFAIAIERVWRPKLMFVLTFALVACGLLSQGRAVLFLVPASFAAVLISYGFSKRRSRGSRRALKLLIPSLALLPALFLVYYFINPIGVDPNNLPGGFNLTTPGGIEQDLFYPTPGGARPSYGLQLKIAVDNATSGGLATALAGRGLGVSQSDSPTVVAREPGAVVTSDMTASNSNDLYPLLDTNQQSAGIWLGQILTETGWIGVAVFLGLLLYMVVLGRRTRRLVPPGSLDRAVLVALPGLAVLALGGSVYIELFFQPAFNAFFWPLLGVCIAIAAQARAERAGYARATHPVAAAREHQPGGTALAVD